jgi:protein dithiol oxidoreductase (disulfide-forming)
MGETMLSFIKPVFSLALLLVASTALAQPALYVEGTHYEAIAKPVRTADPNKIEVTEEFWYGCPHCYEFEPLLASWASKAPSDVAFVRSHVIWDAMTKFHAQILYTEQALGSFDKTHQVVFDAIHKQRKRLTSQEEVRTLFATKDISAADFDKAWTSFSVSSGVKQAEARMKDYGINSVPTLIVNGKYKVLTGDAVPTHAAMLKVVDFLVAKERASAKH